jgi:hypothetical protein
MPELEVGDSVYAPQPGRASRITRLIISTLLGAVAVAGVNAKLAARPAVAHLAAHGYSIMGLSFIDAAAYRHSIFTGLLVTGISFLVFEWKASGNEPA